MTGVKTAGFTIVEVVLFLALSALFLLVAFSGFGDKTRNTQFTDAMRNLQSYVQRLQNDVLNGVNTRSNTACQITGGTIDLAGTADVPGSSDCIIMGRTLGFTPDSSRIQIRTIVGRLLSQASGDDFNKSEFELINASNPKVLTGLMADTYDIDWQVKFTAARQVGSSSIDRPSFGFIRSPGSSNIFSFLLGNSSAFYGPPAPPGGVNFPSIPTTPTTALYIGNLLNAEICFRGEGTQQAKLLIGGQSDTVELVFDQGC